MTYVKDTSWIRLKRIMLFGDSYATQFSLGLAELILAIQIFSGYAPRALLRPDCLNCAWAWGVALSLAFIGQMFFLMANSSEARRASTIFSFMDSALWLLMNLVVLLYDVTDVNAPLVALGLASGWVFITSGYSAYGKRSTDHGRR